MKLNQILLGDALEKLKELPADSVDCIVTDPPYGYSFMGKDWDKVVMGVLYWKECLRVLKPGGFAFVMSAPRQDVLSRMIVNLQDAGFQTGFSSIYWAYATGFPKASNIGKMIDKRNGRNQDTYKPFAEYLKKKRIEKGLSMSQIDKELGTNTAYSWWEGRAAGIQLPSKEYYLKLKELLGLDSRFDELIEREEAEREVIAQKSKLNAYSDQGYSSGVGNYEKTVLDVTKPALDKAREFDGSFGGFQPKPAVEVVLVVMKPLNANTFVDQALSNGKGVTWLDHARIPTDELKEYSPGLHRESPASFNDDSWKGKEVIKQPPKGRFPANLLVSDQVLGDFSRFFNLDKWAEQLPFLVVPKASRGDKNKGLENKNVHPTVKPLKLMSYLITLGSREGDLILDPFAGSGTTLIAAHLLDRKWLGIEKSEEYLRIALARLKPYTEQKVNLSIKY